VKVESDGIAKGNVMTNREDPTMEQLLDWLEGRLTPAEAEVLAAAVQANEMFQEQAAWLRDFLQFSRTTVLVNPPASVHQAANAAFAEYASQKRPFSSLQSFIASLTADNWQRLSLAGVRNVTLRTTPRQLIYSSDLADVALNVHVQTGSQHINLDGQLFLLDDCDPADFIAQLLQDGIERRLTICDALGKFSLTNLPPGNYSLLLSRPELEIDIGSLELA